jgi:Tol biopolymer transport system component
VGASAQTTTRVSVDSSGAQGNFGSAGGVITRDGRYIVFTSAASNLGPTDTNGADDIYRKDLRTGAVVLVSANSSGVQGNGSSIAPVVSTDGNYVAFYSDATNLVSNDTNGKLDIFLRDISGGRTILVTHAVGSTASANADSLQECISSDGRYVSYYSFASDLVGTDTNGRADAFVFDRTTDTNTCVSVSSASVQGNDTTYEAATLTGPPISDDGRFIAFVSAANNLVAGDTNSADDIFVRDTVLGTTARVSVDASGTQGNADSRSPTISADGRWVAFGSGASNLVPSDTSPFDYFVKDLKSGAVDRVSVSTGGGQGSGGGGHLSPTDFPWISADGRFVTYGHSYTNLVPGDTNGKTDIFRHDRWLVRTERQSVDSSGNQGDDHSTFSSIAVDGTKTIFSSSATDLVASDTNAASDVFLRTVPVAYTSFCFGDGTAGTTACPCSQSGSFRHGCENSSGTSGGVMFADGTASVSADTITLYAARIRANALTTLFEGTTQVNGGLGAPGGDGLRCVAGTLIRLVSRSASADGLASFGFSVPGDPLISVKGLIPTVGATRYYQAVYRDAASFCTSYTFNDSSAITIVWTP